MRKILCMMLLTMFVTPAFSQPMTTPDAHDFEPLFHIKEKRSKLRMVEQFSKIIETDSRIVEARDFDPTVISVSPVEVNRLRVQALTPGVTTINVLDEDNQVYSVEVFVTGDVRHLQAYLTQLFPSSSVDAIEVKDSVVLRGWVTQPEHITEMMEIAEEFYPRVLNQMKVGGVQQVMLKVKFLEVSRSKIRKMGFNFLSTTEDGFLASTPGSLMKPVLGMGSALTSGVSSDPTVSFGIMNPSSAFTGFLEALKEENLLKIKAEPTLVTTNGRPAMLLNGGEFPVPVPQGLGTATIEWKTYGVNLEAVPIILGNGRLRLELQPSVSERDFTNALVQDGLTIPGLTTRKVNTQVEMKFGQTLMIAGLITKRNIGNTSKTSVLGEFPVVGAFFSRKRFEETESELLVLVTPEYVSPLDAGDPIPLGPGESTTVPTDRELWWDGMLEIPKYGDPAQFAPVPPMQGMQYNPIPMSPYMLPPQSFGQDTVNPSETKLPPAPAVEARKETIPVQSSNQSAPGRYRLPPTPTANTWGDESGKVNPWKSSATESAVRTVNYQQQPTGTQADQWWVDKR